MRIKPTRLIALLVVLLNIIIIYYTWRLFIAYTGNNISKSTLIKITTKVPQKRIGKLVTVVIRDFEPNENDVSATVESFLNVFPNVQILLFSNGFPYPPLDILASNVTRNIKIIDLNPSLYRSNLPDYPVSLIRTKYVLFIPDSTRISNRHPVQSLLNVLKEEKRKIVATNFVNLNVKCLNVDILTKQWTLKYLVGNSSCDVILGKHVLMMETSVLRQASSEFQLPFPYSLYLHTSVLNYKIRLVKGFEFREGKMVFKSHHARWKKLLLDKGRTNQLHGMFGIKKLVRENGSVEINGCTRDTVRCFETVLDETPSYLYVGKWTPPCCLENLRRTAKRVFSVFNEAGIRYWLESSSLLGAMRNSDILPWDYDVDVGFNRDDMYRSIWIQRAHVKPTEDTEGFLWEKATEGNFFRVHFSKTNRIFVNLFPFYSKNGTMTKDAWFTPHKNMEFPEQFLHPMSSIEFIGQYVPSPNNIRDFLELKFGKDAIENIHYPYSSKLKNINF